VDRSATAIAVLERPGLAQALTPAARADIGKVEHPARPGVHPPVGDG
jgi:hypothetical protein